MDGLFMNIRDLMRYPIDIVSPEANALEAVKRMAAEKRGSMLATNEGLIKECQGIVIISQILLNVLAEGRGLELA